MSGEGQAVPAAMSEGAWIRKTSQTRIDYPATTEKWLAAFREARKRKTRWTIDEIEKLLPEGTHLGNLGVVLGFIPFPPGCPFSNSLARFALYLRMHREGANIGAPEASVREAFVQQEEWEADGKVPERNPRESKRSWLRRKTCWEKRRSEANALFLKRLRDQTQKSASASGRGGLPVPTEHPKSCRGDQATPAKPAKDSRAVPARSSVRSSSITSRKES